MKDFVKEHGFEESIQQTQAVAFQNGIQDMFHPHSFHQPTPADRVCGRMSYTTSTPCHRTTRKCSRFSARTHGTRALEPSARHLSRHVPRAALRRRISKVEGQVQLIEQVLESVDQQGAKERSAM